jgi:DNA transposition AAA+ family ATPase
MSEKILSTANNERIWDAFHQVMERLKDPEALGMGVCYGYPGLGKTVTAEQIHAQMSESQTVDTYWVHAIKIWTPAAMLRDFAVATGFMPSRMNANDLLHELRERLLRRPGVFLIDEAHVFVTKGTLNELVKYLYDSTQCAFLFFGEPQTWKVIEGFVSFASRFNKNAIVEVQKYSFRKSRRLSRAAALLRLIMQSVRGSTG